MSSDTSRKLTRILIPLCLLAVAGLLIRGPERLMTVNWARPFDAGENWLLAPPGTFDTNWFPLFPAVIAAIQYHIPSWLQPAACKLIFMLPLLLAFSAGCLLHSFPAGIFSALLSSFLSLFLFWKARIIYEQRLEQALITAALLMLVNGLAVNFRSSLKRGAAIGLLLAVALYTKGVILLFFPLLLLYETRFKSDRVPFREQWPAATVFLAAVLAWAAVNRLCGNGFMFLEGWSRAGGFVTGATGLVSSMEGDMHSLAGGAANANLTLWAAGEILSHPVRYFFAIPQRLYLLLATQPLAPGLAALFLLWLAGIFRLRRLETVRPLLLLTVYFLFMHLLMPVEGRYFVPVWFLTAVLGGVTLAEITGGVPEKDGLARTGAKLVFAAAAAPMLVFWAGSLLLLLSYPVRVAAPRDLYALEAKYPGSPTAHVAAARYALQAGELERAAKSYEKAYQVEKLQQYKTDYLRTMFLADKPSGAWFRSQAEGVFETETLSFAALRYAEEGNTAQAGKLLSCALHACIVFSNNIRDVATDKDVALLRLIRKSGAKSCLDRLSGTISLLDSKRQKSLLGRLEKADPDLWRPDSLLDSFEKENKDAGGLAAFRIVPGPLSLALPACRGMLPQTGPVPGEAGDAGETTPGRPE